MIQAEWKTGISAMWELCRGVKLLVSSNSPTHWLRNGCLCLGFSALFIGGFGLVLFYLNGLV